MYGMFAQPAELIEGGFEVSAWAYEPREERV